MQIVIEELFGHFNYNIAIRDNEMTVLTGPNGFGKSTILKILLAMAQSDMDFFFDLAFDKITFRSAEKEKPFVIEKNENGLIINGVFINQEIYLYFKRGVNAIRRNTLESRWIEDASQQMSKYSEIANAMSVVVGKVYLIQEQRLVEVIDRRERVRQISSEGYGERKIIKTIEQIPRALAKEMGDVASAYSKIANELDSTYPVRLFDEQSGITEEEFNKKIEWMQEKVRKLDEYGISNIPSVKNIRFKIEDARALKIYFEDFEKKYEAYADLIRKLDLYKEIVNKRFKFKKIKIINNEGMLVQDDNGKMLNLTKLSSGEQEIIVLFYRLLFETPDNVLILIDEPEISLHVAWQRMFASDLNDIIAEKKIKVIVATHSPQIVAGKQGIQIDLGELYKYGRNNRDR